MKDEAVIRIIFFGGILAVMSLWEVVFPKRKLLRKRSERWLNNLGIIAVNTVAVRFLVPLLPVGLAVHCRANNIGLFNNIELPYILEVLLAVIILDLIIYLQHVMFHTVPVFWRLHLVHHADLDIDVTTGLRFHPIEIILSMVLKLGVVYVLGAPPVSVLIFEIVLNGMAMFNHSNAVLPLWADRVLRYIIVTPDMHRVHHSVIINETNSNFGFNLSLWDRVMGTYREQPAAGHERMSIGIAQYRKGEEVTLPKLLVLPFTADPGGYAINRRGRAPHFTRR